MLGQYRNVIENPTVQLMTLKDLGRYDETIQPKDSSFDRNKVEKKYTKKVIEYEEFLGLEECIMALILHMVVEL